MVGLGHRLIARTSAMLCLALGGCGNGRADDRCGANVGIACVPSIPEPAAWRRWSDPASWPRRRKPRAGEDVAIPNDVGILLDESPPPLGGIVVEGSLMFEDATDLALRADYIVVHGRLRVGTERAPHTHRATITLTDTRTNRDVHSMGTRGIMVMGGILELVSIAPTPVFTRLDASSLAGASELVLESEVSWNVGDRIAITPTDFRFVGGTETSTIASVDRSTIGLTTPLARARYGALQSFAGRTLDERAEVANLSRTIRIEGANDAVWAERGFGAHVMIMRGSLLRMDGVELRRAGQRGRLARYPIHLHRMSYADDGRSIGDVVQSYVRRVAVSESSNRCIVIHGTNGLRVTDNVCSDILGHAIYFEDAVERRNVVERNLTTNVRNPANDDLLVASDGDVFQGGSSGFWVSNPDNTIRHNVAADSEGNGFWLSFPPRPKRLHQNVRIEPAYLPFGVFDDNVAHSNGELGLNLDWVEVDDEGNLTPFKYQAYARATQSGSRDDDRLPVVLNRFVSYKNGGALWNRAEMLDMIDFVLADDIGTYFSGGSTRCTIRGALVVGTSGNDSNRAPRNRPPNGAASYHSSCDIVENTFVNLPLVVGFPSGAFNTDDYYIRAVDRGLLRNLNNAFVDAHPGYRTPFPEPRESYALAGALWDPYGLWGPAGNYWVYDTPFLTSGTTCRPVDPAGRNGMSCVGPYYGVAGFYLDGASEGTTPLQTIEVTRKDADDAVFRVGDGTHAPKLGMMRHFAMLRGGRYVLRFPGSALPREVLLRLDNFISSTDHALLAIELSDGASPRLYETTWQSLEEVATFGPNDVRQRYVRRLTEVASLEEVETSDGTVFFWDASNHLVWVRVRGGLPFPGAPVTNSDEDLYRMMRLVIESAH